MARSCAELSLCEHGFFAQSFCEAFSGAFDQSWFAVEEAFYADGLEDWALLLAAGFRGQAGAVAVSAGDVAVQYVQLENRPAALTDECVADAEARPNVFQLKYLDWT